MFPMSFKTCGAKPLAAARATFKEKWEKKKKPLLKFFPGWKFDSKIFYSNFRVNVVLTTRNKALQHLWEDQAVASPKPFSMTSTALISFISQEMH